MDKKINYLLGAKLKEMRLAKNYSLRDVANLVGKTHAMVNYYEIGRNQPDLSTLKKLCSIYGQDMMKLLDEIYEEI